MLRRTVESVRMEFEVVESFKLEAQMMIKVLHVPVTLKLTSKQEKLHFFNAQLRLFFCH